MSKLVLTQIYRIVPLNSSDTCKCERKHVVLNDKWFVEERQDDVAGCMCAAFCMVPLYLMNNSSTAFQLLPKTLAY